MHSSRMRTARMLPVSPSKHCAGGSAPGGFRPGGVHSRGVSPPGGLPLGCLHLGVCLWPRGSAFGPGERGIPACNGPDFPLVNRILDTCFWKYYLAPTSLRAVKMFAGISGLLNCNVARLYQDNNQIHLEGKKPSQSIRWLRRQQQRSCGWLSVSMYCEESCWYVWLSWCLHEASAHHHMQVSQHHVCFLCASRGMFKFLHVWILIIIASAFVHQVYLFHRVF